MAAIWTTPSRIRWGRRCASNLKCLCRKHHLLKTFWGWLDRQLPDGTVIWTAPSGQTYTTHPGSRLLFPDAVQAHRARQRTGERAQRQNPIVA